MKGKIWLAGIFVFASCNNNQYKNDELSKADMLRIVRECDNQFSVGVHKKDSSLLANIYSDSAQYVQPDRPIITGKSEIGKEWGGFIKMKENPIDLVLNINDVRGTREVIYETGNGYTLLADSAKWNFNYVNVWRLQKDDSYKLEVGTYSPLNK
jgi:ketosteroid isomerase-like protein